MSRNLNKEDIWAKEKYERINARIDKKLGIELKEKLQDEKKSIASWITECAKKYLKKN